MAPGFDIFSVQEESQIAALPVRGGKWRAPNLVVLPVNQIPSMSLRALVSEKLAVAPTQVDPP
jgi:hypothetical protein